MQHAHTRTERREKFRTVLLQVKDTSRHVEEDNDFAALVCRRAAARCVAACCACGANLCARWRKTCAHGSEASETEASETVTHKGWHFGVVCGVRATCAPCTQPAEIDTRPVHTRTAAARRWVP